MSVSWSSLIVLFLAIVLASFVKDAWAKTKEPETPSVPVSTGNPILDYCRAKYPNAL